MVNGPLVAVAPAAFLPEMTNRSESMDIVPAARSTRSRASRARATVPYTSLAFFGSLLFIRSFTTTSISRFPCTSRTYSTCGRLGWRRQRSRRSVFSSTSSGSDRICS